ncbi:MAG: hypothetical protein NTZ50_07585 [Chloroflexi bacterium]|nr:hypothetical protein [Chloroflexota bacterium]
MTTNDEMHIARIELQDALLDEEGSIAIAPYRCVLYVRVPDASGEWLNGDGNELTADAIERVLQAIYGATWREGNVDGSFFRVLKIETALLRVEEMRAQPWLTVDDEAEEFRYWFWCVVDGVLRPVTAEELAA